MTFKFISNSTSAAAIFATLLLAGGAANAASISYSDQINTTKTNWVDSLSLPRFDTNLGELQSVNLMLEGVIEGDAFFESLDAAPATITLNLTADIILSKDDNTQLLIAQPLIQEVRNVGIFDGVLDFDGTSGGKIPTQTASAVDMITLTDAANLAWFTGTEEIVFEVKAKGASVATGAGNIVSGFNTKASANVKVTYEYEYEEVTETPEPSAAIAFGLVGAFGYWQKKRRANLA